MLYKHLLSLLCRGLCTALIGYAPAFALAAIFNNGAINNVDYYAAGSSIVRNSASGQATTVNALAGARFNTFGVEDTSVANFYAGSVSDYVDARNQSTVSIYDGSFLSADATDSSTMLISGGTFIRGNNTLRVLDDAAVTINGGSFTVSSGNMVVVLDNGTVTILGGTFTGGRIYAGEVGGRAIVNIYGGRFLKLPGDDVAQIINVYDTVTTIYGRSFNLPFGVIAGDFNGSLAGVLANGDVIDVNLQNSVGNSNTGKIVLVQSAIPEPGSFGLFSLGFTTLIAIVRRRGKWHQSNAC